MEKVLEHLVFLEYQVVYHAWQMCQLLQNHMMEDVLKEIVNRDKIQWVNWKGYYECFSVKNPLIVSICSS